MTRIAIPALLAALAGVAAAAQHTTLVPNQSPVTSGPDWAAAALLSLKRR